MFFSPNLPNHESYAINYLFGFQTFMIFVYMEFLFRYCKFPVMHRKSRTIRLFVLSLWSLFFLEMYVLKNSFSSLASHSQSGTNAALELLPIFAVGFRQLFIALTWRTFGYLCSVFCVFLDKTCTWQRREARQKTLALTLKRENLDSSNFYIQVFKKNCTLNFNNNCKWFFFLLLLSSFFILFSLGDIETGCLRVVFQIW